MLPGIGSSEIFVIALVALIVVGPKDLPGMLRKLGQFVSKMRGMANEFRASFDEMARQSELDDLRKEVEALRSGNFMNPLRDEASEQVFADIDASLQGGGVQFPPVSYQPEPEEAAQTPAAPDKPRRKRAPKVNPDIVGEAAPARKPRASRKKAETPS
ncbi:MAG: Sec-independent protein translocase protein TatB [Caulobacter sp.]|nr:Sec-independent protein translocase protein TatB [Caulobacter sp.]